MNITNKINLALREFSSGNKESAYKKLKKIFEKNKNNNQLRFNLAVIEQSLGLNEEAKVNYLFLIESEKNIKAITNLYLILISEDNYIEAIKYINQAIDISKNLENLLKDKAFVLYKLKQYDESIGVCNTYLKNNNDIVYLNILSLNYFKKGELDKSLKILKMALKIDNDNPLILNSLGRIYHEKRDSANAEKFLLKAYKIKKDSYEIVNNLAGFYREESKYDKSIQLYNDALKINPNNPSIINNLAKAYFDVDKLDLAEKFSLKALSLNENDGNIQKILSLIYLRKQNYKNGWRYFDGRLNLSDFVEKNPSINNIRKKLLMKDIIHPNSKILVLREQGVGDEILYSSMYKDLLLLCPNTKIECDRRLKNIFCNSFPDHNNNFVDLGSISENLDSLKKYDFTIYAGSLGRYFRNTREDFDNNNIFLKADDKLTTEIKNKLNSLKYKYNIGISWKSFKNRYADEKSLNLNDLTNILQTQNCNFINLQYGEVYSEINKFNKGTDNKIVTLDKLDLFNDFDKLAAVLMNLDLFISVSNSTAHLAGGLGVKTILIKPKNHALFHYWNQPDYKTPWYKSVSLIEKNQLISKKNLLEENLNL